MPSAVSLPAMRPAASGLGRQRVSSSPCHGVALQLRRGRRGAFAHDHYGGALVDEGMTVLRRRIREARMAETNYEAPAGWADWEKRYYPAYVSDVSALACALQLLAMGTRPSFTAVITVVLLAGVPLSAVLVLHLLGQAVGSVLHSVS